jgi:hypothetical protein
MLRLKRESIPAACRRPQDHLRSKHDASCYQSSTSSPEMAFRSESVVATKQLPRLSAIEATIISTTCIGRPCLLSSANICPYRNAAASSNGQTVRAGSAARNAFMLRSRDWLHSIPATISAMTGTHVPTRVPPAINALTLLGISRLRLTRSLTVPESSRTRFNRRAP